MGRTGRTLDGGWLRTLKAVLEAEAHRPLSSAGGGSLWSWRRTRSHWLQRRQHRSSTQDRTRNLARGRCGNLGGGPSYPESTGRGHYTNKNTYDPLFKCFYIHQTFLVFSVQLQSEHCRYYLLKVMSFLRHQKVSPSPQ